VAKVNAISSLSPDDVTKRTLAHARHEKRMDHRRDFNHNELSNLVLQSSPSRCDCVRASREEIALFNRIPVKLISALSV